MQAELDKHEQNHDDPGAARFTRCNHRKFKTVKIVFETAVPACMSLKTEDEMKQRRGVLPEPAARQMPDRNNAT
jgi:hypothetical protein